MPSPVRFSIGGSTKPSATVARATTGASALESELARCATLMRESAMSGDFERVCVHMVRMREIVQEDLGKPFHHGDHWASIVQEPVQRDLLDGTAVADMVRRAEDAVEKARTGIAIDQAISGRSRESISIGMCPLCAAKLPNDGSCCDECDWVLQ